MEMINAPGAMDNTIGYSYFGARYYDSDLSVWLSVDPLSDKYPNLSPYAYCANNPVMLVDPDGNEIIIYYENSDGNRREYHFNGKENEYFLAKGFEKANVRGDKFTDQVKSAYYYNVKNGGGKALKQIAESENISVNIRFTSDDSEFAAGDNTIRWNPLHGILTTDGYVLSPATVLEHEAKHKLQSLLSNYWTLYKTYDAQYGDPLERDAEMNNEAVTAAKNKEVPSGYYQKNHSGTHVVTDSELSTKYSYAKTIKWANSKGFDMEVFKQKLNNAIKQSE